MGLFDFGDRAMVKSIANRVNIGIGVLANELDHSNGVASIAAKGIAGGIKREIKEMRRIANSLSESSRSSILITMEGRNIQLPAYFFTLKMISNDCKNAIGFEIFE